VSGGRRGRATAARGEDGKRRRIAVTQREGSQARDAACRNQGEGSYAMVVIIKQDSIDKWMIDKTSTAR